MTTKYNSSTLELCRLSFGQTKNGGASPAIDLDIKSD